MTEPESVETVQRRLSLAVAILIAGILILIGTVTAAYFIRAQKTTATDQRLCGLILQLVKGSDVSLEKPGQPGYYYYHRVAPKEELVNAHKGNVKAVHDFQAVCSNLPSG